MFRSLLACSHNPRLLWPWALLLGFALVLGNASLARAESPQFALFAAPMYVVFADGGAVVGAEYLPLPWLGIGASFGGYAQRPLRRNWLTRLELTAGKTFQVGAVLEGFLTAGLRNIVLHGDSYVVRGDGDVHKERFAEAQFAGSLGLGAGYDFTRHALPLRLVARAELLTSAPYFEGAALDLLASLRVSYRFGGGR